MQILWQPMLVSQAVNLLLKAHSWRQFMLLQLLAALLAAMRWLLIVQHILQDDWWQSFPKQYRLVCRCRRSDSCESLQLRQCLRVTSCRCCSMRLLCLLSNST